MLKSLSLQNAIKLSRTPSRQRNLPIGRNTYVSRMNTIQRVTRPALLRQRRFSSSDSSRMCTDALRMRSSSSSVLRRPQHHAQVAINGTSANIAKILISAIKPDSILIACATKNIINFTQIKVLHKSLMNVWNISFTHIHCKVHKADIFVENISYGICENVIVVLMHTVLND